MLSISVKKKKGEREGEREEEGTNFMKHDVELFSVAGDYGG